MRRNVCRRERNVNETMTGITQMLLPKKINNIRTANATYKIDAVDGQRFAKKKIIKVTIKILVKPIRSTPGKLNKIKKIIENKKKSFFIFYYFF